MIVPGLYPAYTLLSSAFPQSYSLKLFAIIFDAIELVLNLHQDIDECLNCGASIVYMVFLHELYRNNIFLTLQPPRSTGKTDGINSSLYR